MSKRDADMKMASGIAAVLVHGAALVSLTFVGAVEAKAPLPATSLAFLELPPAGQPRLEVLLPEIVEAPPPSPPAAEAASLSRRVVEVPLPKKPREVAEKSREQTEELTRKAAAEQRRKAMRAAVQRLEPDPRAHVGEVAGVSADVGGRNANALHTQATWLNRVVAAVEPQFTMPSVIPADVRKKLNADVFFRIDDEGKLVGEPQLKRSSGNKFFDDAAIAALRRFGPGTQARIPVPPATFPELRRNILKNGLTLQMTGDR